LHCQPFRLKKSSNQPQERYNAHFKYNTSVKANLFYEKSLDCSGQNIQELNEKSMEKEYSTLSPREWKRALVY
jgi:hypothetical protein